MREGQGWKSRILNLSVAYRTYIGRLERVEAASGVVPINTPEMLVLASSTQSDPGAGCGGDDGALYVEFENRFRAPEQEGQRILKYIACIEEFLGSMRTCAKVVDVGCGRGEFLEALMQEGLRGEGVEMNPTECTALRARGMAVFQGDANAFLRQCSDRSLSVVTALQVVEHMSPEYFVEFVKLLGVKVGTPGLVILETPNILCPEVHSTFYLDLSHVRPYPRETLQFYLEDAGFTEFEAAFSSPCTSLLRGLSPERNYLDCAIIAQR